MSTKLALFGLLALSLLLLVGCGYNGNTSTSTTGSTTTVTAVTPGSLTPGATTVATVSSTGTPESSSGHVTLTLSATGYHAGDTIVITITNGTNREIAFADHQSNCSIVLLQRQNGDSWQPVNPCRLMIATRILFLSAGKSEAISLRAPGTGWQKGTYRVAFGYTGGSSSGILYSPLFQVS